MSAARSGTPRSSSAALLEREQRVAQRGLGDPQQKRARHAQPEPLGQQPPDHRRVERADRQPRRVDGDLERRAAAGPPRQQVPHGRVPEPARRERERLGRRRIEPLHVVDRHHHRAGGAERVEHAERDRVRGRRRVPGRGAQQRHLERRPLRRGQRADVDAVEQIGQRGERVLGLGARRSRHEHGATLVARGLDARLPQRRLADARPAGEHQRGRRRAQGDQLGLSADDHRGTLTARGRGRGSRA
jgi:hypothetical protein